jgi:hypothetical protein
MHFGDITAPSVIMEAAARVSQELFWDWPDVSTRGGGHPRVIRGLGFDKTQPRKTSFVGRGRL